MRARLEQLGALREPADLTRCGAALDRLAALGLVSPRAGAWTSVQASAAIHEAVEGLGSVQASDLPGARRLLVEAVSALGRDFAPEARRLLDAAVRLRDADADRQRFDPLVARLAVVAGVGPVERGLGELLAKDPEHVLDFLEAATTSPERPEDPPSPGPPAPPSARSSGDPLEGPARREPGWRRSLRRAGDALAGLVDNMRTAPGPRTPHEAPEDVTDRPGSETHLSTDRSDERSRRATVSTGFSRTPGGAALPSRRALQAATTYQFWVEIGPGPAAGAIETDDARLPALDNGTEVRVVLFGFDDELQPVAGSDSGTFRMDGLRGHVTTGPLDQQGRARLHLPVVTPAATGTFRLRCNLYVANVLVQSRLVHAEVRRRGTTLPGPALVSQTDFALSTDLGSPELAKLSPHVLSVLVNDNGAGTHGFRFAGAEDFTSNVTVGEMEVVAHLGAVRAMLRRASWGNETEPQLAEFGTLVNLFATRPSDEQLAKGLGDLARAGFKLWDVLVDRLSPDAEELQRIMRRPGSVQFANKASLDLLFPAACLYDYPLASELSHYDLCPTFAAATGPLVDQPCFQGDCPSREDTAVVCPSGFWGFRHRIGYSTDLHAGEESVDLAVTVGRPGPVAFTVGASTDPLLCRRAAHLEVLRGLTTDWEEAMSRTRLLELFAAREPSVVYLYGHGGRLENGSTFAVGTREDGQLTRSMLRNRARWQSTRPLVFLNGCFSASLTPADAFSFATGFLTTARASAVVGTEISVFESLAVEFAEECLRRFVAGREPLGAAILHSRLALLEAGNPMGLAYLAFGPVDARLVEA